MRFLGCFGIVLIARAFFAFGDWHFLAMAMGMTFLSASFDVLIEDAAKGRK